MLQPLNHQLIRAKQLRNSNLVRSINPERISISSVPLTLSLDFTAGNDGYGYTQTVFGSFHENFQQRAQKLLRERRQAVATSKAAPLKRMGSGVIARMKSPSSVSTGPSVSGGLSASIDSTSSPGTILDDDDDSPEDQEAEEITAKWGTVAAALYWAVDKVANVNTVLVYLFVVGIITGMLCVIVDIAVYFLTTGRMYFFTLRFFDDRPWLAFPLWISYTCGFVGLSLYANRSQILPRPLPDLSSRFV